VNVKPFDVSVADEKIVTYFLKVIRVEILLDKRVLILTLFLFKHQKNPHLRNIYFHNSIIERTIGSCAFLIHQSEGIQKRTSYMKEIKESVLFLLEHFQNILLLKHV
jgi:hypothetical protein